jgi:hypothetical protein
MRAQRPCRICADEKAIAWINVLTEQEGLSPRRIARAKQMGYGFTRKQISRHLSSCHVPTETEEEEEEVSYLVRAAIRKRAKFTNRSNPRYRGSREVTKSE